MMQAERYTCLLDYRREDRAIMAETHPPLTWGQVKAWARDNEISEEHVVVLQQPGGGDDRACRDLNETETMRGEPAFLFQVRWG